MNIFNYLIKKLLIKNSKNNTIDLIEKKNDKLKEILNSNTFAKILRNQSEENLYIKSKVLVLAPHPDDEVIGCGGSLEILSDKNSEIQIIYITNGVPTKVKDFENQTYIRKNEAIELNQKKKFQNPIFFDLETRKVQYKIENKINDLKSIVKKFNPEIIFVPFVIDRVDDHEYTNKLLFEALKNNLLKKCMIFSYQVSNFINLNCYVNITDVFERKVNMMKFYKSVLRKTNYISLFKGLNLYNSFFVKKHKTDQEEFFEVFLKQSINDYIKICKIVFENNKT